MSGVAINNQLPAAMKPGWKGCDNRSQKLSHTDRGRRSESRPISKIRLKTGGKSSNPNLLLEKLNLIKF